VLVSHLVASLELITYLKNALVEACRCFVALYVFSLLSFYHL